MALFPVFRDLEVGLCPENFWNPDANVFPAVAFFCRNDFVSGELSPRRLSRPRQLTQNG